jgi:hypothetical protein
MRTDNLKPTQQMQMLGRGAAHITIPTATKHSQIDMSAEWDKGERNQSEKQSRLPL